MYMHLCTTYICCFVQVLTVGFSVNKLLLTFQFTILVSMTFVFKFSKWLPRTLAVLFCSVLFFLFLGGGGMVHRVSPCSVGWL